MYAVIGVTGKVGGATARHLLQQEQGVRALVRDAAKAAEWKKQGVQLVTGDLHDADAVRETFAGTEGAFVMTPPYYQSDDPMEENRRAITAMVEAVHEAGLPKMVLLSSIGAERESGTGAILKLHELERELCKLGIPVAAIRAAWFMENFAGVAGVAQQTGKLPSFLAPLDRAIAMIATEDIGALAAELLTDNNWSGKRVVNLERPRRYSPNDVAAAFAKVLGRPVQAEEIPHERWTGTYESFGMTPSVANELAEMMDGLNAGLIEFEGGAEHRKGSTELEHVLRGLAQKN